MKNTIIEVKKSVDGFNGKVHTTEEIFNKLRSRAKKIILDVAREKRRLGHGG